MTISEQIVIFDKLNLMATVIDEMSRNISELTRQIREIDIIIENNSWQDEVDKILEKRALDEINGNKA